MMTQDFNDLRGYSQGNDPENQDANTAKDWLIYETAKNPRTVDFQMLNGDRQNFNYGHYIKSWIGSENNERFIRVFFSTDTVTINGYALDKLYEDFRSLSVYSVRANSQRYAQTMTLNDTDPFITNITIEKHGGGKKEGKQ